MKKLLIPIVIGLVFLALGAGIGFHFGGSSSNEEQGTSEAPPGLMSMEPFLVNISDSGNERFAKLRIDLAIAPEGKIESIQSDTLLIARMRDRVLSLLTSKSFDELSGPMGREAFRNEIRMRLAPIVEEGEIREVLFSEFVIQ